MKNKYLRKIRFKRYAKYFYIGFLCLGCFILGIYFTYSKFSVSKDTEVIRTTVGDFISGDVVIGTYINGEYSKTLPQKSDGYEATKVVCDNNANGTWDNESWRIIIDNLTIKTKCNIYFEFKSSYEFEYTSDIQEFTVPKTGIYKLEVWGAQGSDISSNTLESGYGGYSSGLINLAKGDNIFVIVGGQGATVSSHSTNYSGGYNGGGNSLTNSDTLWGAGGGATSIQNILINDGLLKNYEESKDNILIVAGGGGGFGTFQSNKNTGGSGGGYVGNNGTSSNSSYGVGGNQTSGCHATNSMYQDQSINSGSFGLGGNGNLNTRTGGTGGGGGYYGGSSSYDYGSSAGGGSGYIGNSLLSNKIMYCYNCTESSETNTKTVSTTCSEETPTENCAKKGNGYAKITLINAD